MVCGPMGACAGLRSGMLIVVSVRAGLGSVRLGMGMVRSRLAGTLNFGAMVWTMVRTMVRSHGMSGAGKCYGSSCHQGDYEYVFHLS